MRSMNEYFAEVRLVWGVDPQGIGEIVHYAIEDSEIQVRSVNRVEATFTYDLYEAYGAPPRERKTMLDPCRETTFADGSKGRVGPKLDVSSLPWCLRRGW